MGELGIILAILCGVWVFAIVNDPDMEPDDVPVFTTVVTAVLFFGAIAAGVASAVGL